MDVILHYPQLEDQKEEIIKGVQNFFNNNLREPLSVITKSGPSDKYVLDVFFDIPNNKWYLIEINPFQTSSSGHLFKYWNENDMNILENGPFELRLSKKTDEDSLSDVPSQWREKLKTHDVYGIEENDFTKCSQSLHKIENLQNYSGNQIQLLNSGDNFDCIINFGSKKFKVHKKILSSRSSSFFSFFENQSEISFDSNLISEKHFVLLLEFIYSNFGEEDSSWDCDDWNSLMMAALEIDLCDITEKLIQWREKQTSGSNKSKLYGDEKNSILPGWKSKTGCFPDDCLSFSFEIEGNGLQILKYYRPESIEESKWLEMSYSDRIEYISRNWAHLKRKIKNSNPSFYWMNENLTIEDSGFLWEVSYGGDSAGYCLDIYHLLDEYSKAIDSGLGIADRFMDSGIQMHIAFPLFQDESQKIRRDVLSLMIHLDDYAFLTHFPQYIYDDCNNLWNKNDIDELFNAENEGLDSFESIISKNGMPNPAVKHKHIGLRGIDTYKVKNRFGFEFRRGFQTEELPVIFNYIATILSKIGNEEEIPIRFSWLNFSRFSSSNSSYNLSQVVDWIQSNSRVCPFDIIYHSDDLFYDIYYDKLLSIALPWINTLVRWEKHLIDTKNLLWGNKVEQEKNSPELFEHGKQKIFRRIAFVLCSDWRNFPSNNQQRTDILNSLAEEQSYIKSKINQLLGETVRQNSDTSEASIRIDNVNCDEIRDMIIDFAGRLSRLF